MLPASLSIFCTQNALSEQKEKAEKVAISTFSAFSFWISFPLDSEA